MLAIEPACGVHDEYGQYRAGLRKSELQRMQMGPETNEAKSTVSINAMERAVVEFLPFGWDAITRYRYRKHWLEKWSCNDRARLRLW